MFIFSGYSEDHTGFRFIREPHFPLWTLSSLMTGSMRIQSSGKSFDLLPDHLMLIEFNTPYQLEVHETANQIYAYFTPSPEIERLLNWPSPIPGFRVLKFKGEIFAKQIEESLKDMFRLAHSNLPNHLLFAENALEKTLLLAQLINPNQLHIQQDERILQIMDFIDGHIEANLTLESLAKEIHLSTSRFAHFFREQMGKGPMEYVEERRMRAAQNLLITTNKSIGEISEVCGFQNQFHFSTRFKKFTGKSPRDYRYNPLPS
ncbi:MAG: helix-turn-helix domain-containing protein [Chthoniobacterales bacterium]